MFSLPYFLCVTPLVNRMSPRWTAGGQLASTTFSPLRGMTRCFLVTPLVWVLANSPLHAIDIDSTHAALSILNRSILQDQGAWVVDYRLQYSGKTGIVITPDEIVVRTDAWVSNSRVPSHALPRWSSLLVSHGLDLSAISDVVVATEEAHRCRERLGVSIWTEDRQMAMRPLDISSRGGIKVSAHTTGPAKPATTLPLSLGPDTIVRVRLRFDHQHIIYGDYDPLLAVRSVMMVIGPSTINDILPLNREQYLAQPKFQWPEPPEERRDKEHAISGPDSLHLEAHIPGHQYYKYMERPVRYNTIMRLRFWYLIAAGTEGDCKVRVAQYKETPVAWRMLNNSGFEQCLKTVGRWTKVECIIQTEPEATKLTLEFKIVGDTEVGEMWIDDVSLEPIGFDEPLGP